MSDREKELLPWAVLIASCTVSVLTLIYVRELMRLNTNQVTSTPAGPSSAPPQVDPIQISTQSSLSSTQTPESTLSEQSTTPSLPPGDNGDGNGVTHHTATQLTPEQRRAEVRRRAQEAYKRICAHPRTNKQALRLLVDGHKPDAVAHRTGVSINTVRRYDKVMREAGVSMNLVRREAGRIENR